MIYVEIHKICSRSLLFYPLFFLLIMIKRGKRKKNLIKQGFIIFFHLLKNIISSQVLFKFCIWFSFPCFVKRFFCSMKFKKKMELNSLNHLLRNPSNLQQIFSFPCFFFSFLSFYNDKKREKKKKKLHKTGFQFFFHICLKKLNLVRNYSHFAADFSFPCFSPFQNLKKRGVGKINWSKRIQKVSLL